MQSEDRAGMARRGGGRGLRGVLVAGIATAGLLTGATTAGAATVSFAGPAASIAETDANVSLVLEVTATCGLLEFSDTTLDAVLTPAGVNPAAPTADYTSPATPASVSFNCTAGLGGGTEQVTVTIKGDDLDEFDETFDAKLVAPSAPGTTVSSTAVTITDDDVAPVVTLAAPAAAAAEGTAAVGAGLAFPVSLSAPSGKPVTVSYTTADGTAAQPADYLPATADAKLTIPAGQTTASLPVAVNADPIDEDDETLTATLSVPVNATLGAVGTRTATGTIADDDTSTLSVSGSAVNEGAAGTTTSATATITLSTPSARTVTVAYSTTAGSATAGDDYVTTTGTVSFNPGQTNGSIPVTVNGDGTVEPDEIFGITLNTPVNATILSGTAVLTIKNDDTAPPASGGTGTGAGAGTGGTGGTPPGTGVVIDPGKTATIPPITTSVRAPIRLSTLRYNRKTATLRYDVRCPDAAGRCKGTLTAFSVPVARSKVKALRKEHKLGSKKFDLAGGQTVTLSIRLTKAAKGWLQSARSFKAIAYAVSSSTKAGVSTAKTTGTLKR